MENLTSREKYEIACARKKNEDNMNLTYAASFLAFASVICGYSYYVDNWLYAIWSAIIVLAYLVFANWFDKVIALIPTGAAVAYVHYDPQNIVLHMLPRSILPSKYVLIESPVLIIGAGIVAAIVLATFWNILGVVEMPPEEIKVEENPEPEHAEVKDDSQNNTNWNAYKSMHEQIDIGDKTEGIMDTNSMHAAITQMNYSNILAKLEEINAMGKAPVPTNTYISDILKK